jgi:hypothetical protein
MRRFRRFSSQGGKSCGVVPLEKGDFPIHSSFAPFDDRIRSKAEARAMTKFAEKRWHRLQSVCSVVSVKGFFSS